MRLSEPMPAVALSMGAWKLLSESWNLTRTPGSQPLLSRTARTQWGRNEDPSQKGKGSLTYGTLEDSTQNDYS